MNESYWGYCTFHGDYTPPNCPLCESATARRITPARAGLSATLQRDDQQKVLACDKYKSVGENLYAIGLTIEATRGIERWGSVTTEQAFAGYIALEEKTMPSCWETLGLEPLPKGLNDQVQQSNEMLIMRQYRIKAGESHPDKPGGSPEKFDAVVKAKDMALQLANG